jgi:hypothetical protein
MLQKLKLANFNNTDHRLGTKYLQLYRIFIKYKANYFNNQKQVFKHTKSI